MQGPRCHCGCPQGCGLPVLGCLPSGRSLVPRGFIGASAGPPQGPALWVRRPVTHVFLKPRSVGCCFPGRLVGGPTGGNHCFLCHCESRRPPPSSPDKGFGPRARSGLPQCLQLLALGLILPPSGSASSRDPLFHLEVLLCRFQACLLTPAFWWSLLTLQAWLRKRLVGGYPPARGHSPVWSCGPWPPADIASVFSGGPWIPEKHRYVVR